MINQLFTFSSTIERLRQGPLNEHLDAYAAAVAEQGYTHDSIRQQIVVIADFSRWLAQKHIDAQALDSQIVDRYLRLRRRQQRIRRGEPKTLARLLAMLGQKGVVKQHQQPVADNVRTRITNEFRCYLLQDRGLSPSTLLNYVPVAEQFLAERFHNAVPSFAMIQATHVTGFVLRHARQLSPVRAGLMVTALRAFFCYLRHRGVIATDLAACVPTVPNWSLSTIPRFLPAAAVERILECCDQTTSVGRRNHTILLLLARLGVRAGEVVGLSLDDIDWSTGQITIRGKGGNPGRIHQALTSYQLAMALKGAIELEIFTHIAAGATTSDTIAPLCGGTEKGVRVLCDYLTVHGFLTKAEGAYGLASDTAALLDKKSPSYMGSVAEYFTHPAMVNKYRDVAALVRNGGATDHTLAPNDNVWVEFARYMAPMFALPASITATHVTKPGVPTRVLDIAAGHGLFGIHVALYNSAAEITFQDWENVLEVACENAAKMGIAGRFGSIPGSAFEVALGTGYDLVLLPNFLHHFDFATNLTLLRRVRAALKPGGLVAVIEFVPNEDRVSPPDGALFAMRMLGTTPCGDAYTFAEIDRMLHDVGFGAAESRSLSPAPQQLILARND